VGVRRPQDAGGVDQRVKPAQLLDGQAYPVDHRILAGDIHRHGGEPVGGAGLVGPRPGVLQTVGRDVGGHDGGALVQQAQRGGLADARRGARHQDPFALESLHCFSRSSGAATGQGATTPRSASSPYICTIIEE
jgi:hypothetical protein